MIRPKSNYSHVPSSGICLKHPATELLFHDRLAPSTGRQIYTYICLLNGQNFFTWWVLAWHVLLDEQSKMIQSELVKNKIEPFILFWGNFSKQSRTHPDMSFLIFFIF